MTVPFHFIQYGKLLGHRQTSATARYAHWADVPLKATADRISNTIFPTVHFGGAPGVPTWVVLNIVPLCV